MATGSAVLACSVADPYMVLLMEDGGVELLTVEVGGAEEEGRTRLVQSTPHLGEVRREQPQFPLCLAQFCHVSVYCSFSSDVQGCVCVCIC